MEIKKSRIRNVDPRIKNVNKTVNSISSRKKEKEFIKTLKFLKTR